MLQCQSVQDVTKQQATNQDRDLSLRAEIIKQSYCHVDDESFSVRIDIRLRFANVSDHSVVLSKRIEKPPIVRVAKNVEDAVSGDFEYDPHPDYFTSELPRSPRFGEKPDAKYFVTLAPGNSYEVRSSSGVIGATSAARAHRGSGLLAQGTHVLQLGVGTWPYEWPYFESSTDVKQLSERWSKYGHLANGLIYSDFVSFTIPDKFDNPPCKLPGEN